MIFCNLVLTLAERSSLDVDLPINKGVLLNYNKLLFINSLYIINNFYI